MSNAKGPAKGVMIYHNPRCGTSRTTLALLQAAGLEPEVVEYLKQPPGRVRLVDLIEQSGLAVREVVRAKEKLYLELGLDRDDVTDAALIDAMVEHPILMQRPIVVTPKGVRVCRPADKVREIL